MANKKKGKRRGNPFHAPKTVGEKIKFRATPLIHVLSILSLLMTVAVTVVGVLGYNKFFPLNVVGPFGYNAAYVGMAAPVIMWVLIIFVRIAFRAFPLDMWRMPVDARAGMVKCGGWLLKLATLLAELECGAIALYLNICFYVGNSPSDLVVCLFALVLVFSIWFPIRQAGKIGRGEVAWKQADEAAE